MRGREKTFIASAHPPAQPIRKAWHEPDGASQHEDVKRIEIVEKLIDNGSIHRRKSGALFCLECEWDDPRHDVGCSVAKRIAEAVRR